ncbi:MAG: hypothetical protein H6609_19100 [Ignavibacteriales bacterium]|nr:hypothetical protein [Ignavibacteriales bacterium]
MIITEEDIFKFVWFPSALESQKCLFIEEHWDKFKDAIDYLKDIYLNANEAVSGRILEKIAKRLNNLKEVSNSWNIE